MNSNFRNQWTITNKEPNLKPFLCTVILYNNLMVLFSIVAYNVMYCSKSRHNHILYSLPRVSV